VNLRITVVRVKDVIYDLPGIGTKARGLEACSK
jgi:hypothetical protein